MKQNIIYKFRLDRRAKWATLIYLLTFACGLYWIFTHSSGTYLPAWISMIALALFLLIILSRPKYISYSPVAIEIHCLVELCRIPFGEILRIKRIDNKKMRYLIPLNGVWGFIGYFGRYFDFSKLRFMKLYATKWNNFVMIEDTSHRIFVISVENPDDFIRFIDEKIDKNS